MSASPSLITSSLVIVAVIFPLLASISVALRFLARRTKGQELKSDDWTILLSLFVCWFLSINTFVTAGLGGVNETRLDPISAATLFLRCLWISGIPLGVGLAAIKISILLFYRRIFVVIKSFQSCTTIFIIALIGWGISTVVVQCTAARPLSGAWNPVHPTIKIQFATFSVAFAAISIVFDLMVLCFTLPVIKSLHMGTKHKVTVALIFWLGAFCCVAAAVRLRYLYLTVYTAASSESTNRYLNETQQYLWTHVEPNCSIIAACLPTYGVFFRGHSANSFFAGLRSLFSVSSWSTRVRSSGKGSGKGSESLKLQSQRTKADKAWQKLEHGNNNSVEVSGGKEMDDDSPESQELSNMDIGVMRGFGAEYGSQSWSFEER